MLGQYVIDAIGLICKTLTDKEVVALYLGFSMSPKPKHVMGFKKIEPLYTEMAGGVLHPEVKACLIQNLEQRIDGLGIPTGREAQ